MRWDESRLCAAVPRALSAGTTTKHTHTHTHPPCITKVRRACDRKRKKKKKKSHLHLGENKRVRVESLAIDKICNLYPYIQDKHGSVISIPAISFSTCT